MYSDISAALIAECAAKGLTLTAAESCTGGLLCAALTDVPGASSVFGRGFITYSNEAKTELLGVDAALIATHGAVSEPVALAMAQGACTRARADLAAAVTGIAGPSGGSGEKPVGLVFIAIATSEGARCERHVFSGSRTLIRAAAAAHALSMLRDTACHYAAKSV